MSLRFLRHPATLVVGSLVGLFLLYELSVRFFAYSGDSYVDSNIIVVSAQIEGPVSELSVQDNQTVTAGQQLFLIDPTPFALKVKAAEAALTQARADLGLVQDEVTSARASVQAAEAIQVNASAELNRVKTLNKDGFSTTASLDVATRDLATASAGIQSADAALAVAVRRVTVAQAAIASAEAALERARYELSKTTVSAPAAGRVTPFIIRVGDYVEPGTNVLAIVTGAQRRIVTNISERHLARTRVGQKAWVTLGSDPWVIHRGTVTGISAGVARSLTDPQVLPYVEPSTDWVRLPRRFPVEITLDDWPEGLGLYVGADARALIWF